MAVRWFAHESYPDSIYRVNGIYGEKYEGAGIWRPYPVLYEAAFDLDEISEEEAMQGMKNWDEKRPAWLEANGYESGRLLKEMLEEE